MLMKLVLDRPLGGVPIDWAVICGISAGEFVVGHCDDPQHSIYRRGGSSHRFRICDVSTRLCGESSLRAVTLKVPIVGIGAVLIATAQLFAILNFWMS